MDTCITLNDGHRMPTMGFGTFRLQGSSCRWRDTHQQMTWGSADAAAGTLWARRYDVVIISSTLQLFTRCPFHAFSAMRAADALQNEHDVGAALAKHLADTRGSSSVFVTSKVSPYELGYDKCLESVKVGPAAAF